jgi:hypothetical protein
MGTLFVMLALGMLSSAFGDTVTCLNGPISVTPGLVFSPCGLKVEFGTNPLPDGGQLVLNSLDLVTYPGISGLSFNLNFAFPNPAVGTTVLEYTVCCAVSYGGVSLSADQGSNFSINEAFPGSKIPDLNLSTVGNASLGCTLISCSDTATAIEAGGSLLVVTTITDNAGDLTNFQEGFSTPEPNSWTFLAAGLLCIGVLLRFKRGLKG